jgi:26S proteasome regulatory subunit N5
MSDGTIIKADRDFTKEVDAALPEAQKQAQNGQTQAAVDKLLALEKQTRQSSDLASTSRVIVTIVTICKDGGDWSLLNEQVLVLSKKHGQLKQAITKMVQTVMGFLDDAPSLDVKLSVIDTLRTVTEGKVGELHDGLRRRTTDSVVDLRRGGARTSHPDTVEHQARARRHHSSNRHPL